jgi:RNA polymerase sigma factor (sigma-70 family)
MSPHLSELRKYIEEGDEEAFRKVVSDYIGLVYGTARRRLGGDAHLAADATQLVFTDLAKQAHKLYGGSMLGGWLHRHTCFVAGKLRRAEMRRKVREKTAAELRALETEGAGRLEIINVLDEAVDELDSEERAAIVLRFLEGRSMRSVGLALGVSEDAAQKRTQRALEKLKLLLDRKGVAVTGAALSATLASEAAMPIPAGLIGSVSSAALAGATAGSFAISSLAKMAFFTKPGAILAAVAVLSLAGVLLARQSKPSSKAQTGMVSAGPVALSTRPRRTISSASIEQGLATTTLGGQALDRLKAFAGSDDEALVWALHAFWIEFDTAPEAERPSFRTAITWLTDLWETKSEMVKTAILPALDRLRPPTDRVVDIYLDELASTNAMRVSAATAALMRSGPAARKATAALMAQLERNYRQEGAGASGGSTASMSLEALANIGPDAAAAVPMLADFLRDTNELYRVKSSRAYWRITGDAPTVLPVLTNALLQEHSFWAADILGEMGSAALPVIDSLRQSYRTGSPDARLHAYNALLAIDPSNPPDIQGVRELLDTENSITRLGAIEALWEYSHDPQETLPLLIKVLPARAEFVPDENKILNILGEIGPRATDALPAVRQILERPTGATITRITASNTWTRIAPGTPVPAMMAR